MANAQVQATEAESVAERDEQVHADDDGAPLAHHQHEIRVSRVVGEDAEETARHRHTWHGVAGGQDVTGKGHRERKKAQGDDETALFPGDRGPRR